MARSAEEAKRAVKRCYLNLLELLPINRLVERLYSRALLSIDRKSEIDGLPSPKEKTRHFLDAILIPGLNVDYTGHFDEMVSMMKESDDVLVKCLVEKLIPDISTTPSAGILFSALTNDIGSIKDRSHVLLQNLFKTKFFIALYQGVCNSEFSSM